MKNIFFESHQESLKNKLAKYLQVFADKYLQSNSLWDKALDVGNSF